MCQSILNTLKFREMARHKSSCKSFCTIQIKVMGNQAPDPGYDKSMRCILLVYVSGRWNFYRILLQDSADFVGLVLTLESSIGNIERNLLLCRSFPIRRNSGLTGFSFRLFVHIRDWKEAKHNCKLFSASVESPDAKKTYSWLSSAWRWWEIACPEIMLLSGVV